uniref:Glycosyltransferase n=1 Tax=viral metagenome TaxID=1070528 RepID=A0A6C0K1Y0_9ZZZZ
MIPRIVYQTWYSLQSIPEVYRERMEANKKMNPEYQFVLMDDQDMDDFFEGVAESVRMAYHRINPRYGPARADLFRYVLLYQRGGIYLDIKVRCRVPFREWIGSEDQGLLSYWDGLYYNRDVLKNQEGEIQNWNLAFVAGHPALKEVIRECCRKILETTIVEASSESMVGKRAVLETTGPILWTRHVEPFVIPKMASPVLSAKKEERIRRFSSCRVLDYGDSFHGLGKEAGNYTHYSFLREPLLLHSRNVIPFIQQTLPVCSMTKAGIYLLYPIMGDLDLRSMESLLRSCHVVFAIYHGMLAFLAVASGVPLESVRWLWLSEGKNQERVLYEGPWCVKQAFVTRDGNMCFHHRNYSRFDT